MDKNEIKREIVDTLERQLGISPAEADALSFYKATALTVKNILLGKRQDFKKKSNENGLKRVRYLSMEFLLGRSLKNNLLNLSLEDAFREALEELRINLDELYEKEPDAALGNGGLGRLAACFMDSLTTLGYPAFGYSLLYEYGLFRQMIVEGIQLELPDAWLTGGEVWLTPRPDKSVRVRFGGSVKEIWRENKLEIVYENSEEIEAVPYDMMISGYDTEAVNVLRLWRPKAKNDFNMGLFSKGDYSRALEDTLYADIITKVLYPDDNHSEGKLLRLTQQYFLVSATVQSIVSEHLSLYHSLDTLPDKNSIHINDTHPALVVPELMRILTDEHSFSWEHAWDIVIKSVSYTNHTIMPEALERWREDIFALRLPRIHSITKEINERFASEAWKVFTGDFNTISNMCVIANGEVRMANLSIIGSHSVNGVSRLHSSILKTNTFKGFYKMYPERFTSVTNGVALRRWLPFSNPRLHSLISECVGDYLKDVERLHELRSFADDGGVLERLERIKYENKCDLARVFKGLDPNSIFDVQVKRLHEYKRQLLNALNIISLYLDILENPEKERIPHTFIFGAKAAPGYHMAKRIIKLIWCLGREIEKDERARRLLKVVFIEDYKVSIAEKLIPAAEISEQISLAGKEASGTGCMKLMMNGAVTIGTLDGANVEMKKEVGEENIYIFGLNAGEVERLWLTGYNPSAYYSSNRRLAAVINKLAEGLDGESFSDIVAYLISSGGVSDPYMCLADFESYRLTHENLTRTYAERERFSRISLMNIAASAEFTSDRSIEEYSKNIWGLKRVNE